MTDNINPKHYILEMEDGTNLESIDVIQAVVKDFASFCQGNALKYLIRANDKHETAFDDVNKSMRFLEFWLNDLEGKNASGKRSKSVAPFTKLNELLSEQEKELIEDKNIKLVKVNDGDLVSFIEMLGDVMYGKDKGETKCD